MQSSYTTMNSFKLVAFSVLVLVSWSSCDALKFPSGFKFGAATAAYQVEGAWNVSDKGESIWDHFAHRIPSPIRNSANGDVACDSYHQWERDIALAKQLGIHFYRFSISWPRLLPEGFAHNISEDGKKYYNNLIDGLIAEGIEPLVTMYHWDLPQKLQDYGGWLNPMITDLYADYARVLFSLFGDRVKTWLTFNEPEILCDAAFNLGTFAPGIMDTDRAMYVCNKNVMVAHAKAYRLYDEEFRSTCNGQISLANNIVYFRPQNDTDTEITELAMQYCNGRYAYPIFSEAGGWPPAIEAIIANKSASQGYPRSRLPEFTTEEIALVKGTWDFFGVNFYTTTTIYETKEGETQGSWIRNGIPDIGANFASFTNEAKWKNSAFPIYPAGLRKILNWVKEQYGDIPTLITETGYGSTVSPLNDTDRIEYYEAMFEQISLAIEDGVNVTGYTAWALLDNLSWVSGYERKFGFYQVDFSSSNLTCTPRASASYYQELIKNQTASD